MGYQQDGDLQDLFDNAVILEQARRITDRVGERLLGLVRSLTPVAPPDPDRARAPRTLRESWESGGVRMHRGRRFSIEIFTEDPVAPHVEYPTRPHVIRPDPSRGPRARLRFRVEGVVVYATEVHHPGTKGAYMMTRALAALEEEWVRIAQEELARERVTA